MTMLMRLLGRDHDFECISWGREPTVQIDGMTYRVRMGDQQGSMRTLHVNGCEMRFHAVEDASGLHVRWRGRTYQIETPSREDLRSSSAQRGNEITAEMPGTVVRIHKDIGAHVEAGDVVITIESMKLLMNLSAPHSGKVTSIPLPLNKVFDKGALLAVVEPLEGASA